MIERRNKVGSKIIHVSRAEYNIFSFLLVGAILHMQNKKCRSIKFPLKFPVLHGFLLYFVLKSKRVTG